ncbi:MAG: hypothetical protein RL215_724, partial [Planctomycetota bacterium]
LEIESQSRWHWAVGGRWAESDFFNFSMQQRGVVSEEMQQEVFEFLSAFLSDGDDACDVGGFERIGEAHIGDDGEGKDLHSGVYGHDAFGNGRHPDDIGADEPQHAVFGAGFEVGSGDSSEDSAVGRDAVLERGTAGGFDERFGVGLAHVGKPWSESIIVDAAQGVIGHEVDVVFEDDDVSELKVWIHPSDGACEHQRFCSEGPHDADGEGDFLEGVAFVVVEAAFHGDDGDAFERSEDKSSGVAGGRGARKVWDFGVWDFDIDVNAPGESTESGAEDESGAGSVGPAFGEELSGVLDFIPDSEHCGVRLQVRKKRHFFQGSAQRN